MADNPFMALVPAAPAAQAAPAGNPFMSLVPKAPTSDAPAAPGGANPFMSLVPKEPAKPPSPNPLPHGLASGLQETWERTKDIGKGLLHDTQDEFQLGVDISKAGREQMRQPGVLSKVEGLGNVARGQVNSVAAPLTAVWNALGMADPMMTGGEAVHATGKALHEEPIAAPAVKSGEKVITGPNHAAIEAQAGLKAPQEGFVTPKGEFVGREKAAGMAEKAGEAQPETTGKGLHSEDLPPQNKPPVVQDQTLPKWAGETVMGQPAPDNPFMALAPQAAEPTPTAVTAPKGFTPPKPANTPLPKNVTKLKTKAQMAVEKFYAQVAKTGTHTTQDMDPAARIARAKKQGFNTDLTLYHGTGKDYMNFEVPTGSEPAVFLSGDPVVSDAYSHKGGNPNIIPIWAKMVNPKVVDAGGKHYSNSWMSKVLHDAKLAGHDVVIIKNMHDIGGSGKPQTQYAFFEPGNLRAKYGAAFDPKVPKSQANMLSSAQASTSDILRGTIADREKAQVTTPMVTTALTKVGRTMKAIFAPQTLDATAARAAGEIRGALGRSTRLAERDKAVMTAFQEHIRGLSMQDKLDIIEFMQSPGKLHASGFQPLAEDRPLLEAMRTIFQSWERRLRNAPTTEQMAFQRDYFPQQWKNPEKAIEFAKTFGTKEGSGAFTKQKKIPTYVDGIKAGLEPITIDPIEATLRYVDNVSRFVAINEVFDNAVANTSIVWRAAGHEPAGWAKVEGRMSAKYPGQNAYAPEGWATVYNTFLSRPPTGAFGDALSFVQKAANSVTAFQLGISGYHALNMVGESFIGGIANSVDKLVGKRPGAALGAFLTSPAKFITNARKGVQMQKMYLRDIGSPELARIVDLATEANFRIAGKGRIADEYRFTGHGGLWDAWRKGSLQTELKSGVHSLKAEPWYGKPFVLAKQIGSTTARVMESLSDPLFRHYIPALKNGAYYDMLSTWLEKHPGASTEEQTAFARRAADIIDDRFGEMNQDNIFWQKWMKQVAQASFVSYSYEMGTLRSAAGALSDTAKFLPRLARGDEAWTPKMSYAFVGLPVGVAVLGALYQMMKTGKAPESLRDLYDPKTGGADPASGQPARAVLPSYMSQFINAAYHPGQELGGKVNGLYKMLYAAFSGEDFKHDELAKSTDSTGEAFQAYLKTVVGAWTPITLQNRAKVGTNIGGFERFMGIREAPQFAVDPQGYEAMEAKMQRTKDKTKARHDAKARRVYGDGK